jgi:phthalate 4,5-cis-dihydrodiol dehydrogenase
VTIPKNPPHCGVIIASCAGGDLRASNNGVTIYGHNGIIERSLPPGRSFPDKGALVDELYESLQCDCEPLHNGRWGKATMEASLAVLTSARTGREVVLESQVLANEAALASSVRV